MENRIKSGNAMKTLKNKLQTLRDEVDHYKNLFEDKNREVVELEVKRANVGCMLITNYLHQIIYKKNNIKTPKKLKEFLVNNAKNS